MTITVRRSLAIAVSFAALAAACGGDDSGGEPRTLTLVAYDSFPEPDPENPIHQALAEFTEEAGLPINHCRTEFRDQRQTPVFTVVDINLEVTPRYLNDASTTI